MNFLKLIIIILVAGYLLASLLLYLFQERFIFQAVLLEDDFRFEFNQPYNELNLTMSDGASINLLHFEVDNPKGLILYFHGNAGSLANWGAVSTNFTALGYDMAIMDYRGYGKSRGLRTEKLLLSDAVELYDYFSSNYSEDRMILYGRSLGSGIATYIASVRKPVKLLLETPYNNFTSVVQYHVPIYPAGPSLRYKFPSDRWIKKVACPIFMFHGTEDSIVPYHLGIKLYRLAAEGQAEFVTVASGSHNNLDEFPDYQRALQLILE